MVASIIAYSLLGSSARALKRFSQTPFSAQREKRLCVLLQPPKPSGKSRHGAPARNFQITASTKSRLPRSLLRPTVPGRPGYKSRRQSVPLNRLCAAVHRARLGQRLAIEPQGFGVGNRVFETKAEKTHEREAIAKLIFRLIVGEIVEGLQHQRFEDHEFVPWLAPRRTGAFRVAPSKVALNQCRLKLWPEDSNGTIAAIATSGSSNVEVRVK